MWRYWFAKRDRSQLTSSYSEKQASALDQVMDREHFAYSESVLEVSAAWLFLSHHASVSSADACQPANG